MSSQSLAKHDIFQQFLCPPQEIKQARYITLEEQKEFVDFLDKLDIRSDKLDWCASQYAKYSCSTGANHSTKTNYLLCGCRGTCPRCSMSYATKNANERYQFLKRNIADRVDFDLKMNQIVLTLPKPLHELDEKIFSKMIHQFIKEFDIHAYGYVIQTRHSDDPLGDPYHHAHIPSLNVKEEDNKLQRSDYFFDTNKMRSVWKNIIEKNTGVLIEGNVNVHTEYCSVNKEKTKCVHLLKYLYRYSLEDLFKVQVRNHSINYLEKSHFNEIKEKVLSLIEEKKPKLVWCGLLAPTKQKKLMQMISDIGYHWQSLKEIRNDLMVRANTCPDCGMPFSEIPFETGLYQGDNEPEYPT